MESTAHHVTFVETEPVAFFDPHRNDEHTFARHDILDTSFPTSNSRSSHNQHHPFATTTSDVILMTDCEDHYSQTFSCFGEESCSSTARVNPNMNKPQMATRGIIKILEEEEQDTIPCAVDATTFVPPLLVCSLEEAPIMPYDALQIADLIGVVAGFLTHFERLTCRGLSRLWRDTIGCIPEDFCFPQIPPLESWCSFSGPSPTLFSGGKRHSLLITTDSLVWNILLVSGMILAIVLPVLAPYLAVVLQQPAWLHLYWLVIPCLCCFGALWCWYRVVVDFEQGTFSIQALWAFFLTLGCGGCLLEGEWPLKDYTPNFVSDYDISVAATFIVHPTSRHLDLQVSETAAHARLNEHATLVQQYFLPRHWKLE